MISSSSSLTTCSQHVTRLGPSHHQEDPPAVHHPHRNETDGGEADRIRERGPTRITNLREHVVEQKDDDVSPLAAGYEADVVQHPGQQLAEHVGRNRIRAEDQPYPSPAR